MAVITLGHQSDYGSTYAGETWASDTATADGTGTIDNIEAYTGSGAVSAATASGSGGTYTIRSYDDTLTATTGFNQWQAPTHFTAFDVVSGDVGAIYTAGALHYTTGGDSIYYDAGDQITGGGGMSLGISGSYTFSLYMSGSTSAAITQAAFAFGDDDGTESGHTLGTENTNYTGAANTAKTLRFQLNATADPAAKTFRLKYQKDGTGGYSTIGVGATSDVTPTPTTDSATLSGNNTASTSWAVSVPAYSSGALVLIGIAWDDSTTTTDVTEPAGPNSETILEVNATPATDASTETRCKVWYYVSTNSYAGGTLTFTPSASEQWAASVCVLASGQFDGTTPIGASTTGAATGTAETNIQHPGSWSAGASDGGGRLFCFASADSDPQSVATGFTQIGNQDIGAVSGGLYTRDTTVSDSEAFSATTFATIASDSWASVAFVVRPYAATNDVYVDASANISASGADSTTNRLSTTGGTFEAGRRIDDSATAPSHDFTSGYQSEWEWKINTKSGLSDGTYFEFRLYDSDTALDTYTYTPKWTIGSAGVSGTIAVTLSSFTSSITGQRGHQGAIAQTLSSFTSSIAGAKTVQGTIDQTLDNYTSNMSGTSGSPVEGTIAVTLASFTSAITGTKTIIGTLAQTLASFTSDISGSLTNVTGTIAQTLADFTSSLAGGVGRIGTIARTLGSFLSEMQGEGFITTGSWKDRLIGNRYRHASHYVTTGRRRNRNNG